MPEQMVQEHTGTLSLLCVEDDPITVLTIRKQLEQLFKVVVFAPDGVEGFKRFEEHRPDIIMTDQVMPGMSGLGMLSKIRSINSAVPVILMTSSINENMLIDAINLGVSKFIPKPINLAILRKTLLSVGQELSAVRLLEQTRRQELELLRYRDRYHARQQEMAFRKERHIIHNDLLYEAFPGNGAEMWGVDVVYRSQDIMCGDSYTVRKLPDGRILLFLSDAMGAGLSASITTMLATSHCNHLIDYILKDHCLDIEALTQNLRAYLREILLDDEMLCLGIALIDLKKETLEGAFFGLPPLLVKYRSGAVLAIKGNNPPFSLYQNEQVTTRLQLEEIIGLTIASDGLGEADMGPDKSFRDVMLEEFRLAPTTSALLKRFDLMTGEGQDDLVLLHLQRLSAKPEWTWKKTIAEPTFPQTSSLAGQCLDELEKQVKTGEKNRTELELILTEALTNAYEHGCLRLERAQKDKLIADDEYDDFLLCSSKGTGFISLSISLRIGQGNPLVTIEAADSGAGFNIKKAADQNIHGFSGRGMHMIQTYADGVYISPPGNRFHILKTLEV